MEQLPKAVFQSTHNSLPPTIHRFQSLLHRCVRISGKRGKRDGLRKKVIHQRGVGGKGKGFVQPPHSAAAQFHPDRLLPRHPSLHPLALQQQRPHLLHGHASCCFGTLCRKHNVAANPPKRSQDGRRRRSLHRSFLHNHATPGTPLRLISGPNTTHQVTSKSLPQ